MAYSKAIPLIWVVNLVTICLGEGGVWKTNQYHEVRLPSALWPSYFDMEHSRPEGTMPYTFTCKSTDTLTVIAYTKQ